MLKAPCQYEAGDKVFVPSERRLATVLDTYGDGVHGSHGDMRLDLCGNTSIDKFEPYDPKLHAEYDPTFIPIMRQWKEEYGITQDVQIREDNEQVAADALAFLEQHRVDEDAPTQIPM